MIPVGLAGCLAIWPVREDHTTRSNSWGWSPAIPWVGRPPFLGLVARQFLGWPPASSWDGRPPVLGIVARQFWGWSPASSWDGRPPVLGIVTRPIGLIAPPGRGARGPRPWKGSADTDAATATATATTAKAKNIFFTNDACGYKAHVICFSFRVSLFPFSIHSATVPSPMHLLASCGEGPDSQAIGAWGPRQF